MSGPDASTSNELGSTRRCSSQANSLHSCTGSHWTHGHCECEPHEQTAKQKASTSIAREKSCAMLTSRSKGTMCGSPHNTHTSSSCEHIAQEILSCARLGNVATHTTLMSATRGQICQDAQNTNALDPESAELHA
eukprot:4151868-Amphidinium_carterae.1